MLDKSSIVRAADFDRFWLKGRALELCEPLNMHRKLWEYAIIAQVYRERIISGGKVLGFGVGLEPMVAWFAKHFASVLATDRPDTTADWTSTQQHAQSLEQLRRPTICKDWVFDLHVKFAPVDMNAIPEDLMRGEFDLTWSAGSFEHVGGIEQSLDFFCRQMACLKPGGLAVHTTEYNPDNTNPTLEAHNIVLFRRQELEELERRLARQGDTLWPLDLAFGNDKVDQHVDREPYGLPHLKMGFGPFVTTSVLLVARRGGL